MVEPFPPIGIDNLTYRGHDRNPAVQLFGRRLFSDQTVPEFLVELLLVCSSPKRVGSHIIPSTEVFPNIEILTNWPNKIHLEYAVKARLNLKLFAFIGASKLETRHESHRYHYQHLLKELEDSGKLVALGTIDIQDALRSLENLFIGFQGVGGERTWCAQTFLPVVKQMLAGESIWRETAAKRENIANWDEAIDYFAHNQQVFLARGGEVLYLQICNAMRQDKLIIQEWVSRVGLSFDKEETDPALLFARLSRAINSSVLTSSAEIETVGKLAEFIDTGLESNTQKETDEVNGQPRYSKCGWCPSESWSEGWLFAVEMLRLCEAAIDPIERLELMEIACAMQVLRNLCAQSARYQKEGDRPGSGNSPLGYFWVVSSPDGNGKIVKQVSKRSVSSIQRIMYEAIRHPEIAEVLRKQKEQDIVQGKSWKDPYREADRGYGYKLFTTLAKRIGLITPKRGVGARFVLNERLLRFLIMSTIRPGQRVTYDDFKESIFVHYGIAVDSNKISQASEWCGTNRFTSLGGDEDAWLVKMLDAAGVLVHLSDSFSQVSNPFSMDENQS
jgi:hypothetical protein